MIKTCIFLGILGIGYLIVSMDKPTTSFNSSGKDYFTIDQDSTLQESIARGEDIYTGFCMQCHMADGNGVPGTFPPLANSDYLIEQTEASILAVKNGMTGKITVNGEVYNSAMPKPGLYDSEVADVMNYILNSWGNQHNEMITEEVVTKIATD